MKTTNIVLGTVQFGLNYGINNDKGKPEIENVFELFDFALENGVRKLDTAFGYGNAQEIIGTYHKKYSKQFTVDTKFEISDKATIADQLHMATEKLNVSGVDIYYYHSFNDFKEYPDSIHDLLKLKEEKEINKIGLSVYGNDQFLQAIETQGIDAIQLPFNLLDNQKKRGDLLRLAKLKGKEILTRSSFLQGLFFKTISSFPPVLKPMEKYIVALQQISKEYEIGMEQLALSYVFAQKEIDHLVLGVDNIAQLRSNIKQCSLPLNGGAKKKIDEIDVVEENLLYPFNWKI